MLKTLRIASSQLTITGNGWLLGSGTFIEYKLIFSTKKDGDDFLFQMTEMVISELDLGAFVQA